MSTRRTAARLLLAASLGIAMVSGGFAAFAEPPAAGHAPDPPARPSRSQWIFDIAVVNGTPRVASVKAVQRKTPASTARVMGRYALELYVGRELLDRIRFNVPLTGDGPTPKEDKRPFRRPSFERVNLHLKVRMADNPRARYGLLVDRATGETQRLSWPPSSEPKKKAKKTPPPADAGAPKAPTRGDAGAGKPDETPPVSDGGAPPDQAPTKKPPTKKAPTKNEPAKKPAADKSPAEKPPR